MSCCFWIAHIILKCAIFHLYSSVLIHMSAGDPKTQLCAIEHNCLSIYKAVHKKMKCSCSVHIQKDQTMSVSLSEFRSYYIGFTETLVFIWMKTSSSWDKIVLADDYIYKKTIEKNKTFKKYTASSTYLLISKKTNKKTTMLVLWTLSWTQSFKNLAQIKKKVQIYTKHFIAASVLDSFSRLPQTT